MKCIWDNRPARCVAIAPLISQEPGSEYVKTQISGMKAIVADFRTPERHIGQQFYNRHTGGFEVRESTPQFFDQLHRSTLRAALQIIAAPWIATGDAAGAVQAEIVMKQFKSELRQLEKEVLEEVIRQMIADTKKLEAFQWDSALVREDKEKIALATVKELEKLRSEAYGELQTPTTFQNQSSGRNFSIYFKPGQAFHQIEQVYRKGQFWD